MYDFTSGKVPVDLKEGNNINPKISNFLPENLRMNVFTDQNVYKNKNFRYYITGYLIHPLKYQPSLKADWGPFDIKILES